MSVTGFKGRRATLCIVDVTANLAGRSVPGKEEAVVDYIPLEGRRKLQYILSLIF
jgi:hypothetical protein